MMNELGVYVSAFANEKPGKSYVRKQSCTCTLCTSKTDLFHFFLNELSVFSICIQRRMLVAKCLIFSLQSANF